MKKLILLAALLLLLGFTSSAAADCAWVLWMHKMVGPPDEPEWSVTTAVETLDQCRRERTRRILSWSDLWTPPSPIHGRATETGVAYGGVDERGKQWARGFEFACFPDTIDPREPKGKP